MRPGVAALLLVGLAIAVFARSLSLPFVFDDDLTIVRNPAIRDLRDAVSPSSGTILAVRPIAQLSLALNFRVGGLDVRGYHAFNLAVHVLAGLGLFGLVRRTLMSPPLAGGCGGAATPLALAVAAIWLVHPLQVEAVAYVTQRTELLMGLFSLLTLYAAARAWDSPWPAAWSAASVGACT